jgi:hypothetical protein
MVNKPLDIRQQWLQRVQVARRWAPEQGGFAAERRSMAQWLESAKAKPTTQNT